MRTLVTSPIFTLAILAFASVCAAEDAKTTQFFAELDKNGNGLLEAGELNVSQQKIVAGYARHLGIAANRPFPLAALKKMKGNAEDSPAARFDVQSIRFGPPAKRRVPGFGTNPKRDRVPGFGTKTRSRSKISLIDEDLHQARDRLLRFDRNRNGLLDRQELADVDWTTTPQAMDSSRDGRLDFAELAAGNARERLAQATAARPTVTSRAATEKRSQPSAIADSFWE